METLSVNCLTPEVRRLITFHRKPFPTGRKLSISNSPAKLARAGFLRHDDARQDEVICGHCDITYGDWEGESPFAVHRVLNEHCPFLSTPSVESAVQSHPHVLAVRRRLFPADDGSNNNSNASGNDSGLEESTASQAPSYVSVLHRNTTFSFPFEPKVGDASMLFASRRLKTFGKPRCNFCVKWAEEGFVFRPDSNDVQCVFCAMVFPFDSFEVRKLHSDNSSLCPRVLMKDVGNITIADEERIRLKSLQWQLQRKESQRSYAICHPQYEEESVRVVTYENWPQALYAFILLPTALSDAGFFYTGCADKVKCYCCGLGLYRWCQGSNPWEQHALHMPTCPHLHIKGEHFIQQAAQAQVLTEADLPASANLQDTAVTTGQLGTTSPGSLTLDMSAVTAALSTSQYTTADIRQAILTYFCHTSRYPTKEILLGQLRAADLNFTDLCKQREANYQKDSVIQEKDSVIQEKDSVIQETHTQLQQTHTQLQQTHTQLQQTHTQLQQKDTALQQHEDELQAHRDELQAHRVVVRTQGEELQQKEEELQQKEAELERRRRLMAYQEQQIASLQLQMQSLLAHRRQAQGPEAAAAQAAVLDGGGIAMAAQGNLTCDVRCKVCLSAESNTIFQPCHHISCCKTCAQQLVSEVCPVCRTPISNVLPAFIS